MIKPIDITRNTRLENGALNRLEVKVRGLWELVEWIAVDEIVKKLETENFLSKEEIIAKWTPSNMSAADDDDVVATSDIVSLRDAASKCRIITPGRSTRCQHIQCFDCPTFFALNDSVPTWSCPVCNKMVPSDSVVIDGFFADLLAKAPEDAETVEISADGSYVFKSWRILRGLGLGSVVVSPDVRDAQLGIEDAVCI
ncbi:SUMO ligase siz1 [Quaeritorhiza haematococci]|nr:SUMO ligase siz1 [Quaeritorhiza haematococci]